MMLSGAIPTDPLPALTAEVVPFPEEGAGILERVHPLVPDGEYRLRYMGHQTAVLHRSACKVILWFCILDLGEHFETRISAFYNAKRLIGRAGRNGRFQVGIASNLARDLARVVGPFARMDRLPLDRLRNRIIVGRIGTVATGRDQSDIPEFLRYSVVRALVRTDEP